jgi:Lipopolysaccharide biosynthesis proteins, LPS:glycosyltransferases
MNIAEVLKNRITINEPNVPREKVKQLHIAFGTDEKFARHMGVGMTSIILNNPEVALFFHVFTAGLPQKEIEKLKELALKYDAGIQVYIINEKSIGLEDIVPGRFSNPNKFSFAYYYRLIIPHVVRSATGRILYLDSDIVCIGDLTGLIEIDFEGNVIAAVPNYSKITNRKAKEFGLKKYFNSGMLYIDTEQWCTAQITEKAVALLNDESFHTSFHDQDALNVALNEHTKFIGREWNLMLMESTDKVTPGAVLIHYAGTKPWQKFCDKPARHYYHEYAKLSPWGEAPLAEPETYREIRIYIKKLIQERKLFSALHWLVPYFRQRRKEKSASRQL